MKVEDTVPPNCVYLGQNTPEEFVAAFNQTLYLYRHANFMYRLLKYGDFAKVHKIPARNAKKFATQYWYAMDFLGEQVIRCWATNHKLHDKVEGDWKLLENDIYIKLKDNQCTTTE